MSDQPLFSIPESLVQTLRQAKHIVVLTGAGTSAESGVPTFREAQTGLWAQYDPQELATPEAFRRNPKLVWEWYAWRRNLVTEVEPNPGHYALAQLEQLVTKVTLITQNVDGLHQRAGSSNPIELHGNIMRTKCFAEDTAVSSWADSDEIPPRCPRCGGQLRPDVVWFGESLPYQALQDAIQAARTCDVFFSIGTSSLVQPAASLPLEAIRAGATTVEINPQATPLTHYVSYALAGPSGEVLPLLLQTVW
ncbi:MAG: NAD-dependent deacylase [Anaerolineales bacterium]|nr:NAD-dependent deacylase [Anaerolineales bacterium]